MDDRVVIDRDALSRLVAEAASSAPRECCGVLGGRANRVALVVPVANVAVRPEVEYELDPAGLVAARGLIGRKGLEVLGFYHSHPRTSPEPSSYDVANAWYPECVYVVIGLDPRPVVRAFRIADGRAVELDLVVGQP